MKRAFEEARSSSNKRRPSSSTGVAAGRGNGPTTKDGPLKTENNAFVRSTLSSLDNGAGVKDATSSDDDVGIEGVIVEKNGDVSKQVALSWKMLARPSDHFCPPSNPPGEGAIMEAITVHYEVADGTYPGGNLHNKINAFSFHFSDGGVLDSFKLLRERYPESKLECGSHRVLIPFDKDDGDIKSVIALWRTIHHCRDVKRLVGIRVTTTKGKSMKVAIEEGWPIEESHAIPEGHMLRCIHLEPIRDDWDVVKQRMFQVETVPKEKDTHIIIPFPTLASLAQNAAGARLRCVAKQIELNAKSDLATLTSTNNHLVNDIVKSTQLSLQTSQEAAEVRRLQAELQKAKCNLNEKLENVYATMMKKIKLTNTQFEQDRMVVKAERNSDRMAVLKEHESFLERITDMGAGTTVADEKLSLCQSTACRRMYNKRKLHEHNRCSVEKCKTNYITCGCLVELCTRCSTYMCHQHMSIHENYCKEEGNRWPKRVYMRKEHTGPRLSLLVTKPK